MCFRPHYGLHDASWRDEFGGDIYEEDGSHGCVNLPTSAAATLYDLVDYGTPVIVFRGETQAV
jgi:lipoprotein-anchoring transpeptidase ErfK/SrfK